MVVRKWPWRCSSSGASWPNAIERLGAHKTEGDFLSIVVLLEAVLGSRDWKQISREELHALWTEVRIGEQEPVVTYNHYLEAIRRLNASGWTTGPVIEFKDDEFSPPHAEART